LFSDTDLHKRSLSSESSKSSGQDRQRDHRRTVSLNLKGRFPIKPMSGQGQGSGSGDVASGQAPTAFSINVTDLKRVENKPALVRIHPKDPKKTLDFWTGVFNGLGSEQLDTILKIATKDEAYNLTEFIRGIEYQGFDREFYIRHALSKMSVSVFSRFAVIGALRGSNFKKIIESCETMPADLIKAFDSLGFVKTPKKKTDLTILRCTACIPHWCAYWFIKSGTAAKIARSECPPSLQFPGAASLPMSKKVRMAHLQFCSDFSKLLPGGNFNLNIYITAYNNAIPVSAIPLEVLSVLGVQASSESYRLSETDVREFDNSSAVVRQGR